MGQKPLLGGVPPPFWGQNDPKRGGLGVFLKKVAGFSRGVFVHFCGKKVAGFFKDFNGCSKMTIFEKVAVFSRAFFPLKFVMKSCILTILPRSVKTVAISPDSYFGTD